MGGLIEKLSFTDDELAEIDARASTDIVLLDLKRTQQIETNERRKKKIREDLAYLNLNRLSLLKSGAYTPESLVAEEARLNVELTTLSEAEIVSDISMAETVKEVRKLSELLKNVAIVYSEAKPLEKEQIIRVIFSELRLSENTFDYSWRSQTFNATSLLITSSGLS